MKRVLIIPRSRENSLSVPLTMVCHLTRLAVAAWFIWGLVSGTIFWSDKDRILRAFAATGHPLESISGIQQAAAYSALLIVSVPAAVFVVKFWRLFAYYIAGHIFDRQAVSTFRAMARVAMAVYVLSLVMRSVELNLLSNGGLTFLFVPDDLLEGAVVLFLVTLAEVFSAGAAIADEHSQIV